MLNIDEVDVLSVAFGEEGMVIGYIQKEDITEDGHMTKNLAVSYSGRTDLVAALKEVLVDVIDKYEIKKRQPPETLPSAVQRLHALKDGDE